MSRTLRFRQQHAELLQLAQQLRGELVPEKLAQDGGPARTALGRLLGKLTLHLSIEDKVLYPALRDHPDAKVAALVRRYEAEMATISDAVGNYAKRWPTPSSVKANPSAFASETKQILEALASRIAREDNELYKAADATSGAAFS